ncbi:hypothetical protein [Pseudoxanthomonas sp. CCNWLW206]|uniref:hypothetical protein n=1 Tax=unclassified Pseudoxanthomonas TaxID=2645906 RepID=UPI003077FFE6
MKVCIRRACAVVAFGWLALPVFAQEAAQVRAPSQPIVLPLTAKVEGKGYAQLSARWWQWALSMPVEPYRDPDGRFCDIGQDGPVWFLAGTDGSFDARRECKVPAGKHLFLPVINMFHQIPLGVKKGKTVMSCDRLQASAAVNNDHLVSAVVLIDGVQVKNVASYRVRSDGCFEMYPDLPKDDRYITPLAASDGYWLLIPPLPVGKHTIVVGANYGAPEGGFHRMVQNFEYVLWVGIGDDGFAMLD